MADATIDELLAAIESIQAMNVTLLDLQQLITTLADRLARAEARLTSLEAAPGPKRGRKP